MDRKKVSILAILSALFLVTLACSLNFSAANILTAYMAFDPKGEDRTDFYGQADTFYCIVELVNAPADTLVKAAWTAIDVENTEPNHQIDEIEENMSSGTYQFSLKPENMWPLGKYKVDLYLNRELDRSLEFEVR